MTTKRGNEHLNFTPNSSRTKNSRLNNTVQDTVQQVQQTIAELAKKYPAEKLVQDLQNGFDKLGSVLQAITGIESAEEKERKRSLVVIGLPEPESDDSIERADKDSESVVNMLRTLNIQSRPTQVYRMGRQKPSINGKKNPRLVKVVMSSSFFQRQTLSSLKTNRQALRKLSGFERAIVRPSLSPDELKEDQQLRERLKKARSENPGIRIYIRNKEIIAEGDKSVSDLEMPKNF